MSAMTTNSPYVAWQVRSTHPDVLAASSTGGVLGVYTHHELAERAARDYGTHVEVVPVDL